jgi:hypothetical protein
MSHILKVQNVYKIFIILFNFNVIFFFELIVLIWVWIFSIYYGFQDKQPKEAQKCQIPEFELSYFSNCLSL